MKTCALAEGPCALFLLIALGWTCAGRAFGVQATIVPTDPPSLAIIVRDAEGAEVRLAVAPPEIREAAAEGPVPGPVQPGWERWELWPTKERGDSGPPAFSLSPERDEDGTLILGGLYRAILPETVRLTDQAGKKTFEMHRDYRYREDWGQIANLDGRLGTPGQGRLRAEYRYATQRLDLVERTADGRLILKRGLSVMVCPRLPAPDDGATPLAGVYVAPWRREGAFVVTAEDLFAIDPAPPTAPVRPEMLAGARKKLHRGGELKIAFLGDSVTLGAEAGAWWKDLWTEKNKGYASRVVVGLRRRYPEAVVTPMAAFKGGITTSKGIELFDEIVGESGADVLVVAFGLNDADGPIGGPPKNPPEAFKGQIRDLIRRARGKHMEVLLVTPCSPSPFLRNGIARRIVEYRRVLLELAEEEEAGVADVYTEWMNQARRGIPPFSRLHNWINHPGEEGHALYADVILRCFEKESP